MFPYTFEQIPLSHFLCIILCFNFLRIWLLLSISGRIYDHERRYHQHLPNLQFFATCLRHRQVGDDLASRALNPRLTRRMISMNMKTLSNESLHSIYTNMYKAWLQEFPAHLLTQVDSFAKVCVSILLYPSCFHFDYLERHLLLSELLFIDLFILLLFVFLHNSASF